MHAFHWFPHEHKKIYIQKAYQTLKPGGKLVILCTDKIGPERAHQTELLDIHFLTKDEMKKLFRETGLFREVVVSRVIPTAHFKSYEIFKRRSKAETHSDIKDVDPAYVKQVMAHLATFHDNVSITFIVPYLPIAQTLTDK